ncbi:Pimeloyl-ACP methyl ester carboxylesterase [Phaeovulum vinaykumarii]|uniref:Pimeloyl-ACP methyl ester carboxylesterase n=2 Tax=Phaeovulum vinaykumarii TaxID=407234 RepID=A0A1N7LHF5_9RHOB|nr:Pimeloyl-ACP methyl ester carboxylesterase [Phaeovulum vinaykumarii]
MIAVAGGRVHARVLGSGGRDLVMIHGASGNLEDFTLGLAQDLARDFRVVLFDRPGLGHSTGGAEMVAPQAQAGRLMAAAAALDLRAPIVLGHSYGGAVALAWALATRGAGDAAPPAPPTPPLPPSLPPSVAASVAASALVLVSAAAMPWPGGLGPLYPLMASGLGRHVLAPMVAAYAGRAQIEAALASVFAPQAVPPGYGAHLGVRLSTRASVQHMNARQVNGLKPHLRAMAQGYGGLDLPVEMVHGTADVIVPPAIHARPLARLLPAAHLRELPGVGHMPHHVAPEAVAAAVRRAAGRIPDG